MPVATHDTLGYWLFYTQRCVAYAFAEVLKGYCEEQQKPYVITPPQWGALSLLYEQDGLTIGTISQMRGIDGPTVTGIIKRLEQSGLVERLHDREDRRVVKVYLTDEARSIRQALSDRIDAFQHVVMCDFSAAEQRKLLIQLQRIVANVSRGAPGMGDRFGLLPEHIIYYQDEAFHDRERLEGQREEQR